MRSDLCDVGQSDFWPNLNFLPEPQIEFVLKFVRLLIFSKQDFLHGTVEENIKSRLNISLSQLQSASNVNLSNKRTAPPPKKKKEKPGH